jgi:hypothetical protein
MGKEMLVSHSRRVRRPRVARRHQRVMVTILLVLVAVPVVGTSARGAGGGECSGPPVTMRLEGGDPPAGGPDFEVTDGVARRVPILTGRDEPGRTPKELEQLGRQAAKSKLAMYQVYLADFRISRRDLTGRFSSAFYTPPAEGDETGAVLSIVPPRARGLRAGDVVAFDDEPGSETFTTFAPLGLEIVTADRERGLGTPAGQVEILELDDGSICVAVDFEISDLDGFLAGALEGVVEVPVVKSKNKNLYFF